MDGFISRVSTPHIRYKKTQLLILSSLPLYDEYSCSLGIVTKTYLDELCVHEDPTAADVRAEMRIKCQIWVQHSDLPESLNDAFRLWDAASRTS